MITTRKTKGSNISEGDKVIQEGRIQFKVQWHLFIIVTNANVRQTHVVFLLKIIVETLCAHP